VRASSLSAFTCGYADVRVGSMHPKTIFGAETGLVSRDTLYSTCTDTSTVFRLYKSHALHDGKALFNSSSLAVKISSLFSLDSTSAPKSYSHLGLPWQTSSQRAPAPHSPRNTEVCHRHTPWIVNNCIENKGRAGCRAEKSHGPSCRTMATAMVKA
jgi:hypothetical protein